MTSLYVDRGGVSIKYNWIAIFTADDFLKYFEDKVDNIRRKTEGAIE